MKRFFLGILILTGLYLALLNWDKEHNNNTLLCSFPELEIPYNFCKAAISKPELKIIPYTTLLPESGKLETRALSQIKGIVLHHSASEAKGTEAETLKAIAQDHIDKGFKRIAYHFVIFKNGNVYQVNELTNIGNHTLGFNPETIGICLIGNFDIEKPTTNQMLSFYALAKKLFNQYGWYVLGHNECCKNLNETDCPGANMNMNEIRLKLMQ